MSSIDALDSRLASIWQQIHGGRKPTSVEDDIHNWLHLLTQLETSAQRESLQATISPSQWVALLVLEEWWNNSDQDEEITGRSRQEIERGCIPEHPSGHPVDYYAAMVELWTEEFCSHREGSGDGSKVNISHLRQMVIPIAAAHRLGRQCYHFLALQAGDPEHPGLSVQQRPQGSDFFTKPSIPASIGGCQWLTTAPNRSKGYPRYLWDIQKQRTVEVAAYQNCPDYVAVSHTWGRWRLDQWKKVPGVPWSIPCNSVFDVSELPKLFSNISLPVKHLWFDLVCIPQSDEDMSFRDIARSEIARQAAIFGSARYTMVWLNHITDWQQLQRTIMWLGLEYLMLQAEDSFPKVVPYSAYTKLPGRESILAVKATSKTPDSIKWPQHASSTAEETWEPCGWFTSLWTLQETCMRPRMWLCDRNWEIFSIGNRPVALDDIVALTSNIEARFPAEDFAAQPREVLGLHSTVAGAGLTQLLQMSRLGILMAGTRKYCRHHRAEAIMSAIGCTEWYEQRKDEAYTGNTYPLSFILECHRSIGPALFSVSDVTVLPKEIHLLDKHGRCRDVKSSATLMPFVKVGHDCLSWVKESTQLATRDHPSVASWTISEEGHVWIKQAGLMASWSPQGEAPLPGPKVKCFMMLDSELVYEDIDIDVWLGSFRPESEKHALCLLSQEDGMVHGVLLERIYPDAEQPQVEDDSCSRFFKFGNFIIFKDDNDKEYDFPPITDVHWLVI